LLPVAAFRVGFTQSSKESKGNFASLPPGNFAWNFPL